MKRKPRHPTIKKSQKRRPLASKRRSPSVPAIRGGASNGKRKQRRPAVKSRTRTRKPTAPKRHSRRTHRIRIPAPNGMRNVAVRSSRDASLAGKYWNAVHKYVAQGDASALEQFDEARITSAKGQRLQLVTDLRTLDRLAGAGVLSFESIYGRRI